MKKPFKHTDLSNSARCIRCGKKLKNNLLVKRPNAKLCFKCHKKARYEAQSIVRG
jgi:predicted CXXCH cytochrome family protein